MSLNYSPSFSTSKNSVAVSCNLWRLCVVQYLTCSTSVILKFIIGDAVGSIAIQVGNYRSSYIRNGSNKFVEFSILSHWLTTAGFGKLSALLQSAIDLQVLEVSLQQCCIYLSCICLFILYIYLFLLDRHRRCLRICNVNCSTVGAYWDAEEMTTQLKGILQLPVSNLGSFSAFFQVIKWIIPALLAPLG